MKAQLTAIVRSSWSSYLVIVGLFSLGAGCAAQVEMVEATSAWCEVNKPGATDTVWVEVSRDSIHLVKAAEQTTAQLMLKKAPFLLLSREDVTRFLKADAKFNPKSRAYLVRAAALNITPEYTLPENALSAYLYPNSGLLEVVNQSLSREGEVPTNFAIVIELTPIISRVETLCVTAR